MDSTQPRSEPAMTATATAPARDKHPAMGASEVNNAAVLLTRFAHGDRRAFDELVTEFQQIAYTAAWRILCDAEAAHDVVQEAFMRVLRHYTRYDHSKSFRTWLLSIVRNLSIDSLRRRHRFEHPDRLDSVSAAPQGARMEAQELRERVAMVLDDIPDKYRSIIVMREMEAMPAEDIARAIDVDYSTTRWRLHQARQLFRQAWIARFGKEI
jgi:RNA polymerase sigma-70 factor (ECF subfamily)